MFGFNPGVSVLKTSFEQALRMIYVEFGSWYENLTKKGRLRLWYSIYSWIIQLICPIYSLKLMEHHDILYPLYIWSLIQQQLLLMTIKWQIHSCTEGNELNSGIDVYIYDNRDTSINSVRKLNVAPRGSYRIMPRNVFIMVYWYLYKYVCECFVVCMFILCWHRR